jgi:hypothetical protein
MILFSVPSFIFSTPYGALFTKFFVAFLANLYGNNLLRTRKAALGSFAAFI